jgi:hypothetical protein
MMERAWRGLRVTWWPIGAAFAVVVAAFTRDRACFGRYHLLPGLDHQVGLAWDVAIAYVLGHAWLVAVYASVVVQTGDVVPSRHDAAKALGVPWWQLTLMLAIVCVEYAPAILWQGIGRAVGLCGP